MPAIRDARSTDLGEIQAIYAHWVDTGLSSFEEIPPDLGEITKRWQQVVEEEMPYLVVEGDGGVVGFAYARNYRSRSGYRYTVENSVYIRSDSLRLGLGRSLLNALIETCQSMGYRQMVAIMPEGSV